MNHLSNTMGVIWDSPSTIEAYKILVRTYRKILARYRPESVRDEEFTRNKNNHYVEKGYSRYHNYQMVDVLPNNFETLLRNNCSAFTHHARVAYTQLHQDHESLYPHESVNKTKNTKPT